MYVQSLRWSLGLLASIVLVGCATSGKTPPAQEKSGASQPAATYVGVAPPAADAAQQAIDKAYNAFKGETSGKNADYIPVLAAVDPALYGIALVTVDGRVYQIGDSTHEFSIQSVAKIFTAAKVMDVLGPDAIEQRIGVDATGQPFNSIIAIEMNEKHRAGNPLVNPGAIATVSLIPASGADERWNTILGNMSTAAGRSLTVDQKVYESESATNTRNQAITRLLQAYEVLGSDPVETLDLYTRECSVAVSAHDLAVMGATLANGGINPVTGERLIAPETASKILAVMQTAGLYENSGQWAFKVGVPAKSGVGGGIIAVVPGRYAIGTFSPPLDEAGNSVRGQKAIASIVADLKGNVFDTGRTAPPSAPPPTATPQ
jgi:glutaminase